MVNFVCESFKFYVNSMADIEKQKGIIPALAAGTAINGVIYGIVMTALMGLQKALTTVLSRMGCHGLVSRIAIPALLNNLWTAVAVSVTFSLLTIWLIKKEKITFLSETEENIIKTISEKIRPLSIVNRVQLGDKLKNFNLEKVKKAVENKHPKYLFFFHTIKETQALRYVYWARKELKDSEKKIIEEIGNSIENKVSKHTFKTKIGIEYDDTLPEPSVIYTHLSVKYPTLEFELETTKMNLVHTIKWDTKT